MLRATHNHSLKPIALAIVVLSGASLPFLSLSSCGTDKFSREADKVSREDDRRGVDRKDQVAVLACGAENDRPFDVYDVPGADSLLLLDARVSTRSTLRTPDERAPGIVLRQADLDVAGLLVKAQPAGATPALERDHLRRTVLANFGAAELQHARSLVTVEGFQAEQAIFKFRANVDTTSIRLANGIAEKTLSGPLTGMLEASGGAPTREFQLALLTIIRSPSSVVIVAAIGAGNPPSDEQQIRIDELTDATNVARHHAFTRHECDKFIAKKQAKADIVWVMDDSCSMRKDMEQIQGAANAMKDVLTSAQVDYRLGVARFFSQRRDDNQRGKLEGMGFTTDFTQFKRDILVPFNGGWDWGLEVGLKAIDHALPRTPVGQPSNPRKLREGAATVVIHMTDARDQGFKCVACGGCPVDQCRSIACRDAAENNQMLCRKPGGQEVIDRAIREYRARGAVTFAISGELPHGCTHGSRLGEEKVEPGQGYVEVANGTGGQAASLCGDTHQILIDVVRAASGVASVYQLSHVPASASIRVAVGQPNAARAVPRSRVKGFDYDPVGNKILFYGDARPVEGDEIFIGYRRWDWAPGLGNPNPPPDLPGAPRRPNDPSTTPPAPRDGCDACPGTTSCDPRLDGVSCIEQCGEVRCTLESSCRLERARCIPTGPMNPNPTDPTAGMNPPAGEPPPDSCGGTQSCSSGMVCDQNAGVCTIPCETSGCNGGRICNHETRLCDVFHP